jgi:hypothetical protein
MAILFDFQCPRGHVSEHFVSSGTEGVDCPECGDPARKVYLQPPRLDWMGIALTESAGPEFIDRWERLHARETRRQERILREHGDYGPGYDPPPDLTPKSP